MAVLSDPGELVSMVSVDDCVLNSGNSICGNSTRRSVLVIFRLIRLSSATESVLPLFTK